MTDLVLVRRRWWHRWTAKTPRDYPFFYKDGCRINGHVIFAEWTAYQNERREVS